MTAGEQKEIGHVRALDGIRGLAILLVVIFHFIVFSHMTAETLGERVYRGLFVAGWTGVDLFFVLSGFLITGILLDTKETPHYFRNFYARRSLRIFPLYYAALVGLLWIVPTIWPGLASRTSFTDSLWYWTYLSNLRAAGGWTNTLVDHFWSLAIEEQFYLVWPMAIFVARRRAVPVLCLVLAVGAPIVRTILVLQGHGLAAYTLTPCRADALALGGLLACAVRSNRGRRHVVPASRIIFVISAASLAWICVTRHGLHFVDPVVSTVGFSFVASMYAAIVGATFMAAEGSALKRLLSARVLCMFGKYSYGIYVFHQPVAACMERVGLVFPTLPRIGGSHLVTAIAFTVAGGGLSLAMAMASWHLFEVPFLRLKKHFVPSPPERRPDDSVPGGVRPRVTPLTPEGRAP